VPAALNHDRVLKDRPLLHSLDRDVPLDGLFAMVTAERPLLAYYANSVAHLRGQC
jgi:hypothetical protein